jgi:pimeloyl-ACP methyl ester carboxylesterase
VPEIQLPRGTVRYGDAGGGSPIVFVHGALVDGRLWAPVVERLAGAGRCLTPDLPLGSHRVPLPGHLSLPAVADLVADFVEALGLDDVTLVGNDTGGALCQLVVTRRPERIGRLVLTNCDAFDNLPPRVFRPLVWLARVRLLTAALQPLRLGAVRRSPLAYGWLAKRPIPDELTEHWARPFLEDAGVRRNLRDLLARVDPGVLLDAATRLPAFDRPALIAWAPEDRFFPLDHARRLAAILPDARLEEIPGSGAFVPLDRPDRLAELLRAFVPGAVAA